MISEIADNNACTQTLINKIQKLLYARLPDFISDHCDFGVEPIKCLNKMEMLISENEELFVNITIRGRMKKYYILIESKRKKQLKALYKMKSTRNKNELIMANIL